MFFFSTTSTKIGFLRPCHILNVVFIKLILLIHTQAIKYFISLFLKVNKLM